MSKMISIGVTYDFFPEGVDKEFITDLLGDDAQNEEQVIALLKDCVLEAIVSSQSDPDLLEVTISDLPS